MEVQRDPTDEATTEGKKESTTWKELESPWVRWRKRPSLRREEITSPMRMMTPAKARNSTRKKGMTRK
jgi:hypothetical protein